MTSERTYYNKLVRDKIGDHLARQSDVMGYEIVTYPVRGDQQQKLREKILEEVQEFLDNPCEEEAADVLEVFDALLKSYQIERFDVDDWRFHKAEQKGRFDEGMVLKWVDRKVEE